MKKDDLFMVIFNALQTGMNGGIGRYSYELAKELYKLDSKEIKIVVREEETSSFDFADRENLIIVKGINNSLKRNLYEQFKLPKLIAKNFPNAIIHYPDTMAPLLAKNKVVITVHDLAFKSVKGIFTWKTMLWKNIITNLSVKKAKQIIAITNFTKDEIIKFYPNLDHSKVSMVYNGFNDFSKEDIVESNINDKIKMLKKEYILTVSTISPRKNIDGLIKAFNEIKSRTNISLVVAGNNGWMCEDIYKIVEKLNLDNRIIFTGKVNDDELKYLYKNCTLFIYPSFYEGFGLPPLEAMSFGVPVAVSNVTSIPEVVGIRESFFDPYDNKQISSKIFEIINNKELKNKLIIKGSKRIEEFSWNDCAKNTMKIYESY